MTASASDEQALGHELSSTNRHTASDSDEISDQPASSPETRAKPIKPTPPATKAEPATADNTKVASEQGIGGSHEKTSAPAEQPTESSKTTPASSGRAPNDPREVKKRQLGSQHTPD